MSLLFLLLLLSVQSAFSEGSYWDAYDPLEKDLLAEYSQKWNVPTPEKNLIKNLLLASLNFTAIPTPLQCMDLDPSKNFEVVSIENKKFKICDLCPHLPFDSLPNVDFNTKPSVTIASGSFQECAADCLALPSCLAFNFDQKLCHFYNSTEGDLVLEKGTELVIVTQPTGIIRDWMYSRNTISNFGPNVTIIGGDHPDLFSPGPRVVNSTQESFVQCLGQCDINPYCLSASFEIGKKACRIFLNVRTDEGTKGGEVDPKIIVDYKYGFLAALKVNRKISAKSDSWWRFQNPLDEVGRPTSDFRRLFIYEPNVTVETSKDFGLVPSFSCNITDSDNCTPDGEIRCRNPENSGEAQANLPLCPISRHEEYQKIQDRINSLELCFSACLQDGACVGVTFHPNRTECQAISIDSSNLSSTLKDPVFFPLRIPSQALNSTALQYGITAGYKIRAGNYFKNIAANASVCLDTCKKSLNCRSCSYDSISQECKLADTVLNVLEKSQSSILFVETPPLASPRSAFTKLVASEFVGREAKDFLKSKEGLSKTGMMTHVDSCLQRCLEYPDNACQFVGVDYDFGQGKAVCVLYELGAVFPHRNDSTGKEVFVRSSHENPWTGFAQAQLDKIHFFESSDFSTCFRSIPALSFENLQDQLPNTKSPDTNSSQANLPPERNRFGRILSEPRHIQQDLSDVEKKLKASIFSVLGHELLDVADEITPAVKVNGSSKPVVVRVFQNPNLPHYFQEIPFHSFKNSYLTHSPYRIQRDVLYKTSLSSFGLGESGLANTAYFKPTNESTFTEVLGSAAKLLWGQPLFSYGNARFGRFQFADLEKLNNDSLAWSSPTPNGKGLSPYVVDWIIVKEAYDNAVRPCRTNDGGIRNERQLFVRGRMSAFPVYMANITGLTDGNGKVAQRVLPSWAGHWLDRYNHDIPSTADPIISRSDDKDYWYQAECQDANAGRIKSHLFQDKVYKGRHDGQIQFDKGHLVPAIVASHLGGQSLLSTFTYLNCAPQQAYVNQHAWNEMEQAIRCGSCKLMGTAHGVGAVATGVCPDTRSNSGQWTFTAPVPKCYWKLFCFMDDDGQVRVDAYFHENGVAGTPPVKAGTQAQLLQTVYPAINTTEMALRIWSSVIPHLRRQVYQGDASDYITPAECAKGLPVRKHFYNKVVPLTSKDCNSLVENLQDGERVCTDFAFVDVNVTTDDGEYCTVNELREHYSMDAEFYSLISDMENYPDEEEDEDMETAGISENADADGRDWTIKTATGDGFFNGTTCGKRLVAYFSSASSEFAFTQVTALGVTHAIFAELGVNPDGSVDTLPLRDSLNSKNFGEFLFITKSFQHVKAMVSIGSGANNSASSVTFSAIAAEPSRRLRFIESVIQIVSIYQLQGVDISWQRFYLSGMNNDDRQNYILLLQELRTGFDALEKSLNLLQKLEISISGPSHLPEIDGGLDFEQIFSYIDWINVDLSSSDKWSSLALLPVNPDGENPGRNHSDWVLRYYVCKAKEHGPFKINMGIQLHQNFNESILKDLGERVAYAKKYNLGGFSLWNAEQLVTRAYDEFVMVRDATVCADYDSVDKKIHKCYASDVLRWSQIGEDRPKCGKTTEPINGFTAVCNPYDPNLGCCDTLRGLCGSGKDFCACAGCVNYYKNPEEIFNA